MKKLFLFLLLIGVAFTFVMPINASMVIAIEDTGGGGPSYLTDWTINQTNTSIKSFQLYTHPNFGQPSVQGTSYSKGQRPIYDSWWTNQATVYETYTVNEYRLYQFSKYADIPIEIVQTRSVQPNSTTTFTIQYVAQKTQSRSTTYTQGNTLYAEYNNTFGFNLGASVPLNGITLDASMHSSTSIKVGTTYYQEKTITATESSTFTTIQTEDYILNNTSSQWLYYQLNYRQKYKVYLVAVYAHQYSVNQWGSGLFGLDKNYSYTYTGLKGVETRFYLIPIETPYYEVSTYFDDAYGRKVIYNKSHPSIYYL